MKRRKFISQSALVSTAVVGAASTLLKSCVNSSSKQLTVLHTNDVHSHIEPFPGEHALYANRGGVARRAELINAVRSENPNVLLLDAGDIFQGTPYFNFYGGELEFKLMSKLKYDAATIGNHDFDNGIDGLLAQLPHAQFSFLSANYDFSNTALDGLVKPYQIFVKSGLRVGVFGLGIALEGLVAPNLYKETGYLDPIERALDMGRILKEVEQCDLVICLSHLGYAYENPNRPSDRTLAKKTENIDLIIGGHTHTFLEQPVVLLNRKGRRVMINQVGCYGVQVGRVDFYFDSQGEIRWDGAQLEV